MKSCYVFLLVYLLRTIGGGLSTKRIARCTTCGPESDATSNFLRCVGLPSTDTGKAHIQKLKDMLSATMDVYTFMKSSLTDVPLLSLEGALELTPGADALQNEALVQMWVEVKLKPLLNSTTKHFLSCLSTKNFSCSTYQTIVKELSQYYSDMNPVRQKWIYMFFMYPFLSGDTADGCVNPGESSEEWLLKNFGSFRAMARMKDFSTLNLVFSGLEVLHLLSPTQKAELLLSPGEKSLDNGTLTLVFHSLLTGGSASSSMLPPTYSPYTASSQSSLTEIISGFNMAFTTISSFAHEFVSFTSQRNVSEIKSTTLTQFLLNYTLAELAEVYRPTNTSAVSEPVQFDVTNVEDWYQQVVIPVLQAFWPNEGDLMHENITLAFHELFFLDTGMDHNSTETQDVCSVTLDKTPCGLTDAVENVAHVLHCAARTNLTMTQTTVLRLINELTGQLNSLIKELFTANFEELISDFKEIFSEGESPTLIQQHLEDPEYIKLWFRIKLAPLLPDIDTNLLSCLSTKNFSCPAYQTLVAALGTSFLKANSTYSRNVYKYFIYPFLLNHNTSGPQCVSSANHSAEWLIKNVGFFSTFASVADFYELNPHFSGLEVLPLLSSEQLAEMMLLPLRTPPEKDVVIDSVFDFLLEPTQIQKFPEVLLFVVKLAKEVNPPCAVYRQIFNRLYRTISGDSPTMESLIWARIDDLISIAPEACVPENITCPETQINGTSFCSCVDSSNLLSYLNTSKHVSCNFTLEEYVCAQLEDFSANQLAALMRCDLPGNSSHSRVLWKMLLTKHSDVLDPALDILANASVPVIIPSAQEILDVIGEIRLSLLTDEQLRSSGTIELWFSRRLSGFLPFASGRFLRCLTNRNISCPSYQQILQVFIHQFGNTLLQQKQVILKNYISHFLSAPYSGQGCVSFSNSSAVWLQDNLGPFSQLLSVQDLFGLNVFFHPLEALSQLSFEQLVEVSTIPGLLTSPNQVTMVMKYVLDQEFTAFFDRLSVAFALIGYMGQEQMSFSPVRSAFLQVVFDRANLSNPLIVNDSVVSVWLSNRLPPFLINLLPSHVTPYFQILAGRNCSIEQQGVENLNSTIFTLNEDTQQEIYNHILQALKGPPALRCYGDNYNQSFYTFVENSFMGFQFPNLTTFLSLMPLDRVNQLINSMPPSHLASLLQRPDVVDNEAKLCNLYNNYKQTPLFLETESLPVNIRRPTLSCVWPMALSSSSRSEVDAWFDRRLRNYLGFLTKNLISSDVTTNASCIAFQKLVLVLGAYNYTAADFARNDVFNTIRSYLTSATTPKCYNSSDPVLNSTAWFAEYIGSFMSFLTLDDLLKFGSQQVLQVFTVNPLNIALLNHSALPQNLTNFYTQLVYQQNSNFNPLLLPLSCRCVAPALAFTQLTANESIIVLQNLNAVCVNLDPQIFAALASDFGGNIDSSVISALGNQSSSLSLGQIKMIKAQDLMNSLNILTRVVSWSDGQAKAIIQTLTSTGVFQINSASSLDSLAYLIKGILSKTFSSISSSQILIASKNPFIVGQFLSAPNVVQQTIVTQIISANSNNEMIIQNVPDEIATEIPRVLLQDFTVSNNVVTTLNKKKWKRQQAELFFNVIAVENATMVLGGPANLSSSVLQGFTCTSISTIPQAQIQPLIKACRRNNQNKVTLVETQLTCMYNFIRKNLDATSFDLYPPDVLLYYDYSLVSPSSCRFYFEQLGNADFSIFSLVLGYKRTALFENARRCLGITNTSLTADTVSVLGNMSCMLDSSYIVKSDPSILEKLKNCPDLTDAQAAAVEILLINGTTKYGAPSSWTLQTLRNLEPLTLYMTSTFYDNFDKTTKRSFLREYLKVLSANGVSRQKRSKLKQQIGQSIRKSSKQTTVGMITQVTISDDTFILDYDDINHFNSCLTAATVKDNLEAITQNVDQVEYLKIVLSKLREAYTSIIPEDQVQVLSVASRVATMDDINVWTITQLDTLASLMDPSNGAWDSSLAKAIISKYLSVAGNQLDSAELNAIGGTNLCSLDVAVLKNITQQSLKNANALDVSNCADNKLTELFNIASQAFGLNIRANLSTTAYQLIQPYIAGATADFVRSLVNANVNMDLATFTSINGSIVQGLTVNDVKNLLGTNLPDLKSYENQTLVQTWISRQSQSALDTLGIGLIGGMNDSVTTTSTSAPSPASSTTPLSSEPIITMPSTSSNITMPSTTSNITIPSTAFNITIPSTAFNTTTPSTVSNATTLSTVSNATTLSTVSNATTLSTVSNATTLSTVSNATIPSTAFNTTTPSTVSNATTLSTVSNATTLSTVSNATTLSTVSNATTLSTVSNATVPSTAFNTTTASTNFNTTTLSTVSNATTLSTVSDTTTFPTVSNTTTLSTVSNATTLSTVSNTTIPSTAFSTTIPSSTSNTTIPSTVAISSTITISATTSTTKVIVFTGQCNITMTNETEICMGVNSTVLQLQLNAMKMSGHLCDYSVVEFGCASLSALTAQDLAELIKCNRSSNSSGSQAIWKLLLSKASAVLDEALDLLVNTTLDPSNSSLYILNSVKEIRLDVVDVSSLNDPTFIQLWFNRLQPFMPALSPNFLWCFATKEMNCSTYQNIVQILSQLRPQMTSAEQKSFVTYFIEVFLTKTNTLDPFCSSHINNSGEWLQKNFGGFSTLITIKELQQLYSSFSVMEALPQLSLIQLAEVSTTPGLLTSPNQVTMVMKYILDQQFASFFDQLSLAITGQGLILSSPVRSAFLQVVFDRANLSNLLIVNDSVVSVWLSNRLPPFLINLLPSHVTPYFQILAGRNCSIEQQGVKNLNSTIFTLSVDTQQEIYNHILQALKGPPALRCYGDNYNQSFYTFVENSFMGFRFPNLTTFLSLMPLDRVNQLINSMPPSHLASLLQRPDVVDNEAKLCDLYNNYKQTPLFLETESLPVNIRRPTLSCVWPMALSSSSRSEVDAWFDRRLRNYLGFLTKNLISSDVTTNASCIAFQKLVLVLGAYNYTAADFARNDVFNTIRSYLTSATTPKCYNSSDPVLNSTAWFAEYIGSFMSFLTLDDLLKFGSQQVLQVFTVNPLNIALLNHSALPQNLTNFYTQLVYQQNSNFNPLLLPLLCRCVAPAMAFTQLTANDSIIVLQNLNAVCVNLDPQIFAALTSNFGGSIDSSVISALGNQSSSLSLGQIKMIKAQDLMNSLNILTRVVSWSDGQAKAIIQTLTSTGVFQINSAFSLDSLAYLIKGILSKTFSSISSSQILIASKKPFIVGQFLSAPNVVQQTIVTQIISANSSNELIIQNVPDEIATEIPRVLLQDFTVSSNVVTTLNKKKWKRQQAELFFNVIAVENATMVLGGPANLSSSVLQGFTCTSISTISQAQIQPLIKACRRNNQNKVTLVETQLTCMYNFIRKNLDATSFDLYPPDVLLYYDYSLVSPSSCRFYFEQLGNADFSVFSLVLSYKRTALFENARRCLGITNTSLTADTVSVLGNMSCMLDSSYIVKSDPSILEKLKNCPDLTDAQAAAIEILLINGTTKYGAPSSWTLQTLRNLEPLTLYMTSTFYGIFNKTTKRRFLREYLKVLSANGVSRQKRSKLKQQIGQSIRKLSKRATVTDCTVGMITQVTISDDTFILDYDDINQFNSCLTAATVKDNLEAITQNVDQVEYLKIVLSKLREAYTSIIPEDQVQILSVASRVATMDDINVWTITQLDTLASLMDPSNGAWDSSLAKAIISKYLSVAGNQLDSAELNAIGGTNLCSLDVAVLKNITQQSLKNANALDVSNCTDNKLTELFNIASQAFGFSTRVTMSTTAYQLIQPYIAGATADFIRSLVNANVNMDLATFTSINGSIVQGLTVNDVKNLLGTNLPDLKSYENQTLVQTWISSQLQSELDTLGIGLRGGRATPSLSSSTTPPSSVTNSLTTIKNTATTSTKAPTTKPSTTASTTKGAGTRIQADVGLSFLIFLTILVSNQLLLM